MSGMAIFFIGLGVSALCLLGLYFTVADISRLGRESDARARAHGR